jgi:hypothetical protein
VTPARWGWVSAGLDTASWALSRVRGGWGDDVPDEIRTAAAEAADRIEQIARYARRRMEGAK